MNVTVTSFNLPGLAKLKAAFGDDSVSSVTKKQADREGALAKLSDDEKAALGVG